MTEGVLLAVSLVDDAQMSGGLSNGHERQLIPKCLLPQYCPGFGRLNISANLKAQAKLRLGQKLDVRLVDGRDGLKLAPRTMRTISLGSSSKDLRQVSWAIGRAGKVITVTVTLAKACSG